MVKHCGFSDGNVKKINIGKKCYQEEKSRSLIGENPSKRCEDEEAERVEKSSLTDELDEPVCYLSDGTQSSNKRKRQASPSSTPSITIHSELLISQCRLEGLTLSSRSLYINCKMLYDHNRKYPPDSATISKV